MLDCQLRGWSAGGQGCDPDFKICWSGVLQLLVHVAFARAWCLSKFYCRSRGSHKPRSGSKMARWALVTVSSADAGGSLVPATPGLAAVLPTVVVFCICVSMLLALCAARSNPDVGLHHADHHSSAREPERKLGQEPELKLGHEHAMDVRKLSHRFSSSSAAITKLSASFRISSFRAEPPPVSSSFRVSSFRTDCRSQVDVVDALRRIRPPLEEEEENTEPAVWQRVILRGERCAPLSFSGLILYDQYGNPLPGSNITTSEQGSPNKGFK